MRGEAVKALVRIGTPEAVEVLVKIGTPAVNPLCWALRNTDIRVRGGVTEALVEIGIPAVEPLCQMLGDWYDNARVDAAWALGRIGDARAVDPLCRALKDKNLRVRRHAAEALGALKRWEAFPALKARLRPLIGERDRDVRAAIVQM